jgi:hypothetical protein
MLIKNGRKQSPVEVLSSVTTEMAKPRVAESDNGAGDTVAEGRDRPINPSAKKTPVPGQRLAVPAEESDSASEDSVRLAQPVS